MKEREKVAKVPKKLLLVDDDPNLILLVKDYLEYNGYEVITASHGREALSILERETPDLIICDVMMPEMDGYSFVKQVRENPRWRWLPVIFLSAKGQVSDRIKGLNEGADVYMVKPFEPEELVAQVKSTLAQAERLMAANPRRTETLQRLQVPLHVQLTPTEKKVVSLVASGMSNKEIAEALGVSQRTVESHVSNMLNKTGLNNRTELSRWALENQIV
ncbi:MAG: response regulator transcription factor [Geminocystis sp.]|nr:response regulator transcription factor [Geminocystis sp.]HIK38559.1 response regulator transcription factor [Geminocystis sp. M7585_C2015_104]MCS7147352.1 response regulator transcription factor [Geminocystis sp.]MCX8079066.1 response regulator transcription factor [Geminocystis sp.]MDW8116351.1 response regulator transcription factor [Geminocystis sp.]